MLRKIPKNKHGIASFSSGFFSREAREREIIHSLHIAPVQTTILAFMPPSSKHYTTHIAPQASRGVVRMRTDPPPPSPKRPDCFSRRCLCAIIPTLSLWLFLALWYSDKFSSSRSVSAALEDGLMRRLMKTCFVWRYIREHTFV